MSNLLIGGHSGIGAGFLQHINGLLPDPWVVPTRDDLDVQNAGQIYEFITDMGPWKNVVYSAGINILGKIGSLRENAVGDQIEVNLVGFIYVLDALRQTQSEPCNILVVGSDAAERPLRTSIAYCASKAALHHAVRCAARELGPDGWRINCVAPGMTEPTRMQEYIDAAVPRVRGWSPEQAREYERSQEVTPGRVQVEEVAQVMTDVLMGPKHLNGSIVYINGGR